MDMPHTCRPSALYTFCSALSRIEQVLYTMTSASPASAAQVYPRRLQRARHALRIRQVHLAAKGVDVVLLGRLPPRRQSWTAPDQHLAWKAEQMHAPSASMCTFTVLLPFRICKI